MVSKLDQLLEWSKDLKVLYVEDELTLQEELSILLSDIFAKVDLASDGEEGLAMIRKFNYDIIISDIRMPKLNGIEMIKRLKYNFSETPILVISAHNETDYLVELINLGIENFLTKPLRSQQVFDALHTVVTRINTQKELRRYKAELEVSNTKLKRLVGAQSKSIDFKTAMLKSYRNAIYDVALVSTTSPDGIIKEVNDKFIKAMGFSKEELIGKKHNIMRHPMTSNDTYEKLWKTILAKQTWHGMLVNQTKSLKPAYHYTTIIPILDESGEIYEFLSVKQDITSLQEENQKKLKESVQKSSEIKLHELLKLIPFSTVIFDKNATAKEFNAQFEEFIAQLDEISLHSQLLSNKLCLSDAIELDGLISLKDSEFIDSVCDLNETLSVEGHIYQAEEKIPVYLQIKKLDTNSYICLVIRKEDIQTCFLTQEK